MAQRLSQLYEEISPYIDDRIAAAFARFGSGGTGGGGTVVGTNDHGALTGLGDDDHHQYLTSGRGDGRYPTLTVYNAHVVNANAHHNQAHDINGADHTGKPLLWINLSKVGSSLGELETRNYIQLNSRQHLITGPDHSIGGSAYDVVGNNAGSLDLLTPLHDVSSGQTAILRSNAGLLKLKNLLVGTLLQTDSANYALGINVTPDGAAALDVRAGTTSDHTVRIKQVAGQTGRLWRVEDTSGNELIVLDSVGNLQSGSPGFVSGLVGWQMSRVGNLEANNGRFRGELHATVMVFDEVGVHNGTQLVTPAGGALELDATLTSTGTAALRNVRTTAFADQDYLDYRTDSATGSGTGVTARTVENLLAIKNPDTGHYKLFNPGDILRSKVWTGTAITDVWMRVNSALDMSTYWAYFVQITSGTLPVTLTAGAAVADYGKPGAGFIRFSADDPYGPLIDVATIGAEPWNGDIYPHVRLGRLDGVGVPGLSGILQWGLAGGANLADANSPYFVVSNLAQRMFKILSEWSDGVNVTARIEPTGRARFGSNVDSPALTFLDVDPAQGLATFRGAIEVLSATGYGNFADKPTLGVLAAKNSLGYGDAELTGLGALAAKNAAALGTDTTGNLDNVPNGSTYARVNSTLISGGNIRVGSGTKDVNLNGFHMDASEFVGQAAGVDQVVLGADGKIVGGAGGITLDASGATVKTTHIKDSSVAMDYDNAIGYEVSTPGTTVRAVDSADSFWYGGSNYAAYAGGEIGGLNAVSYFAVDPMYPNSWGTLHSLRLSLPATLPKAAASGYPSSTVAGQIILDCRGHKFLIDDANGLFWKTSSGAYWQGVPAFRSTA